MSEQEIEEIVSNLFTDKYDRRTKLQALAASEIDGTRNALIKKHHPEFWNEAWNEPMVFHLSEAMTFYDKNPDMYRIPNFSFMKMKYAHEKLFEIPDEIVEKIKENAVKKEG